MSLLGVDVVPVVPDEAPGQVLALSVAGNGGDDGGGVLLTDHSRLQGVRQKPAGTQHR